MRKRVENAQIKVFNLEDGYDATGLKVKVKEQDKDKHNIGLKLVLTGMLYC